MCHPRRSVRHPSHRELGDSFRRHYLRTTIPVSDFLFDSVFPPLAAAVETYTTFYLPVS